MRNSRPLIIDALCVALFAIAMFVIIAAAGSQASANTGDSKFRIGKISPSATYAQLFKKKMKLNKKRDKQRRRRCK